MCEREPKISVIIVTWNTREMTLRLLKFLYEEALMESYEVILVDNNSSDGTVTSVLTQFPLVRVLRNSSNQGFAIACNQAASVASGRYLLLLNTDVILNPWVIPCLERVLDTNPDTAIVGPKLLNADGSVQLSRYRLPTPFRAFCDHMGLTAWMPKSSFFGDYRYAPMDEVQEVEYLVGACLLVRKSAFDSVDGFDESFFFYGEEADLSMRLRKEGWGVLFVPEANAIHLGGGSGESASNQVFSEFRKAQERFFLKHYGSPGLAWFRGTLFVGSVIRFMLFGFAQLIYPKPELRVKWNLWKRILLWNVGFRNQGLDHRIR